MIHTFHYICFLELAASFGDQRLVAVLDQAHQLPGSESFEVGLQLAEHEFDRVVPIANIEINLWSLDLLWRIWNIVDPAELQPPHVCLSSGAGVHAQVVHEQGDLGVAVVCSKIGEVLVELVPVHRPWKYLAVLQALLLGDASQERQGWLVQPCFVDPHVLFRQRPFCFWDCLSGEHRLVNVDNAIAIVPGPGQASFDVGQHLGLLGRRHTFGLLEPFQLLLLNAMFAIDQPQQRRVHLHSRELPPEMLAAVDQRHGCLLPERGAVGQPRYLVWLQEPVAEVLSWLLILEKLESLEQRQILDSDGLKSVQVDSPDLGGRDLEEMAQHLVADVRSVASLRDQAPELQLEQVIHLGLGKDFHRL